MVAEPLWWAVWPWWPCHCGGRAIVVAEPLWWLCRCGGLQYLAVNFAIFFVLGSIVVTLLVCRAQSAGAPLYFITFLYIVVYLMLNL